MLNEKSPSSFTAHFVFFIEEKLRDFAVSEWLEGCTAKPYEWAIYRSAEQKYLRVVYSGFLNYDGNMYHTWYAPPSDPVSRSNDAECVDFIKKTILEKIEQGI